MWMLPELHALMFDAKKRASQTLSTAETKDDFASLYDYFCGTAYDANGLKTPIKIEGVMRTIAHLGWHPEWQLRTSSRSTHSRIGGVLPTTICELVDCDQYLSELPCDLVLKCLRILRWQSPLCSFGDVVMDPVTILLVQFVVNVILVALGSAPTCH